LSQSDVDAISRKENSARHPEKLYVASDTRVEDVNESILLLLAPFPPHVGLVGDLLQRHGKDWNKKEMDGEE
jgi:hypothetical protein